MSIHPVKRRLDRLTLKGQAEGRSDGQLQVHDDIQGIDHKEKLFCPWYKVFGYIS